MVKISKIYLDTSVFIYYLEGNPRYISTLDKLFEQIKKSNIKIQTSTLTLTEVFVKPYQEENLDKANSFLEYFRNSPEIDVVEISPEIALKAAYLRAKYNIKTPDSIHLASAMGLNPSPFLTNDQKLEKVTEVNVIILDKLLTGKKFDFLHR